MKHVAYFGDGEKTFALTDTMIRELEHKAGVGIGLFYQRVVAAQFFVTDLIETIRLGLIGAGTSPADAQRLVDTYATDRPLAETVPLALDILNARWGGEPIADEAQDDIEQAATTGDLSAAISAAYAEVPDV